MSNKMLDASIPDALRSWIALIIILVSGIAGAIVVWNHVNDASIHITPEQKILFNQHMGNIEKHLDSGDRINQAIIAQKLEAIEKRLESIEKRLPEQ